MVGSVDVGGTESCEPNSLAGNEPLPLLAAPLAPALEYSTAEEESVLRWPYGGGASERRPVPDAPAFVDARAVAEDEDVPPAVVDCCIRDAKLQNKYTMQIMSGVRTTSHTHTHTDVHSLLLNIVTDSIQRQKHSR